MLQVLSFHLNLKNAVILVLDGVGEFDTFSIWQGKTIS